MDKSIRNLPGLVAFFILPIAARKPSYIVERRRGLFSELERCPYSPEDSCNYQSWMASYERRVRGRKWLILTGCRPVSASRI
jgi:hypothetical protein